MASYTKNDLIVMYDILTQETGEEWPTKRHWIDSESTASESAVRRIFGSWAEFFTEIGKPEIEVKRVKTGNSQTSVFFTDKCLEIIGNRPASVVINQTIERIGYLAEAYVPNDKDREIAKKYRKRDGCKYPDQAEVLSKFAAESGVTVSDAMVMLEKIEQE